MEYYNNPNYPQGNVPQPSRKFGFWGCCSVVIFCVCLFACVCVSSVCRSCSFLMTEFSPDGEKVKNTDREFLCGDENSNTQIAVIDIRGIITPEKDKFSAFVSPDRVCFLIREAEKNPEIKAIIIRMDTPGGEVTASDVIRHELNRCKKPVVVQMNSMAASGGYFIATAADRIVANRMTMTGSIGVVIESLNYSQLFAFLGLQQRLFTSGKMKAMLNGGKPASAEEDKIIQTLVMETYEDFVRAVSRSRKIPVEQLLASDLCDGRILSGVQAFHAGLVDQLGYFEDAVTEAEKLAGIPVNSAKVVLLKQESSFSDILASLAAEKTPLTVSVSGTERSFRMQPGKPYYLPSCY